MCFSLKKEKRNIKIAAKKWDLKRNEESSICHLKKDAQNYSLKSYSFINLKALLVSLIVRIKK